MPKTPTLIEQNIVFQCNVSAAQGVSVPQSSSCLREREKNPGAVRLKVKYWPSCHRLRADGFQAAQLRTKSCQSSRTIQLLFDMQSGELVACVSSQMYSPHFERWALLSHVPLHDLWLACSYSLQNHNPLHILVYLATH